MAETSESSKALGPGEKSPSPTRAFFALPGQRGAMSLREAVARLPESVFVDVLESDDAYLLVFDLPGIAEDTLEVAADQGRLTVEGRRAKDHPTGYRYVREDRSLFVDVTLPLPPDADAEATESDLERGVLTLHVPKATTDGTSVDVE